MVVILSLFIIYWVDIPLFLIKQRFISNNLITNDLKYDAQLNKEKVKLMHFLP